MSTTHAANVISINHQGPDRSPGARQLAECRDQLSEAIAAWLETVAATISEDLFILAEGTRDRLTQTRYLDLRQDVDSEWPHFIDAFRRSYAALSAPRPALAAKPLEVPDFEGLSLVEDDELSERIVIREFASQLAETCDNELYGLDRRLALLSGDNAAEHHEHPLSPLTVCQALAEAGAALGTDAEDRLLLLRRLERHLHPALLQAYAVINSRLIGWGILPDLKRSYRRNTSVPAQTSASTAYSGDTAPLAASTAAAGESGLLGALNRLIALRAPETAPAASTTATAVTPPIDAAAISHAFLASLDDLQHSPLPTSLGMPTVNIVRQVRESGAAQGVNHVDAVTIDIVAMLFDFIFDDADIAPAIKALVSRLQIPVLKTAMLDHQFFADRQHPARRFLDGISAIATRWGTRVDADDPCYTRLDAAVARIQNDFAADTGIFTAALADLEAFIAETDEQADESTQAIANGVAASHEHEALAAERARVATAALDDDEAPESVRTFIRNEWSKVLHHDARLHAAESSQWSATIDCIADLLWSIRPKQGADERMRLIGMLPGLLARINQGLERIDAAPEIRRTFFDTLVALHASALKGSEPTDIVPAEQAMAASDLPARVTEDTPGDLIVTRSQEGHMLVEEVILVGASGRHISDQDALREVGTLRRGDYLEFDDGDGNTSRERLTWISPQGGILVFSNHRAAKAICFTPEALARRMAEGSARQIRSAPLFERAMNGVLAQLHAA